MLIDCIWCNGTDNCVNPIFGNITLNSGLQHKCCNLQVPPHTRLKSLRLVKMITAHNIPLSEQKSEEGQYCDMDLIGGIGNALHSACNNNNNNKC